MAERIKNKPRTRKIDTDAPKSDAAKDAVKKPSPTKKTSVPKKEIAPKEKIKIEEKKQFVPNDLIVCSSVRNGTVTYVSKKTGMRYVWGDIGDSCLVEYQDLLMLLMSRSSYLFAPWIVIDDEELVKDRRWAEVNEKAKEFKEIGDLELYVLSETPDALKRTLEKSSVALREAITSKAFQLIKLGKLDSIGTLEAIKEATGTDLKVFG